MQYSPVSLSAAQQKQERKKKKVVVCNLDQVKPACLKENLLKVWDNSKQAMV